MEELKKQAIIKMKAILSEKQSDLHQSLIDLKESRESDTKSSAGDKYETGREMINQEMDAVQTRLDQVKLLLNEVDNLPVKGNLGAVSTGSLVKTNRGLYLIGPGLGKITIDNEIIFAISTASPLGNILFGKSEGEQIELNGIIHSILEIG